MLVAVLCASVLAVGVMLNLEFRFTDVIEDRLQAEAGGIMGEIEVINDEHTPIGSDLHLYVKNIGSKPLEGEIRVYVDDKPVEIRGISGVNAKKGDGWFVFGWHTGVTMDIKVDPGSGNGYHSYVVEIVGPPVIRDETLIKSA